MSAQLLELRDDDALAETVGDAALAALLHTKPRDEAVPSAVWWLIAESLRTSVSIRRVLTTGGAPGDRDDLPMLITEAALLTEAALAELAETTGATPTPIAMPDSGEGRRRLTTRPTFGLQLSVLFLARMLVSHRSTSPQRLANTLAAHLRALSVIDLSQPAASRSGPDGPR
jgi:hypothetical protein